VLARPPERERPKLSPALPFIDALLKSDRKRSKFPTGVSAV